MKKVYLLAAFAAVITAVLLYLYLQSLDQGQPEALVPVVVAAADIPAYTPLNAQMLTVTQVPQAAVHPKAISDPAQAYGLLCDGQIIQGEQILGSKLRGVGESNNGLSYLLEEGQRALSVAVNSVSGVAGFIRQNDRVDVLVTLDVPQQDKAVDMSANQQTSLATTMMVAENIRVLAVGKNLAAATGEESTAAYDTVTLLADDVEIAEKITFASGQGQICLLLRAVTDQQQSETLPVDKYSFR